MPNGIPPAVSSPGTTRVGTPATLNRLTSVRPAVKASCGASMDGVVEKATGSSRKSTWSEAKKASTCLERACLWSRAA